MVLRFLALCLSYSHHGWFKANSREDYFLLLHSVALYYIVFSCTVWFFGGGGVCRGVVSVAILDVVGRQCWVAEGALPWARLAG